MKSGIHPKWYPEAQVICALWQYLDDGCYGS